MDWLNVLVAVLAVFGVVNVVMAARGMKRARNMRKEEFRKFMEWQRERNRALTKLDRMREKAAKRQWGITKKYGKG